MVNHAITTAPGDNLDWLVAQIHDEKIARIQNMPATNLGLTREAACAYLRQSCLLEHELTALLFGMIPHLTETADDFSCLEPGDNVVVRRVLADKKAGRLTFPMRIDEVIDYLVPWQNELPDELAYALDAHCNFGVSKPDTNATSASASNERKNSAATTLGEVGRTMANAISLLETTGMTCQPALPGTKAPYCEYLRLHSNRLHNLSDGTLHDYMKRCSYVWKQSGGEKQNTDPSVRLALQLPSRAAEPNNPPDMGKSQSMSQNWLQKIPPKT